VASHASCLARHGHGPDPMRFSTLKGSNFQLAAYSLNPVSRFRVRGTLEALVCGEIFPFYSRMMALPIRSVRMPSEPVEERRLVKQPFIRFISPRASPPGSIACASDRVTCCRAAALFTKRG
jgi:hypothetical protein